MSQIIPSQLQLNIYDFIKKTYPHSKFPSHIDVTKPVNLTVSAVAGGAKSTTIRSSLEFIPREESVLFLAFNNSIVDDLKGKIPKEYFNVQIKTLHSFGMSALNFAFKNPVMDKEGKKYKEILDTEIRYGHQLRFENDAEEAAYRGRVLKLIDLGRLNLAKSPIDIERIALNYDIEIVNGECKLAYNCMERGMQMPKFFDFTDMIWLPVVLGLKVRQFQHVYIDESQDLSACQHQLFLKAIDPKNGRFIAVGDPHQAIYMFAGASSSSFEALINMPNTVQMPLSVCYRCDKAIIRAAQQYVPQIQWRDGAEEGVIDYNAKVADVQDGDLVMCRNTFPLVVLCMKFLSDGKKAFLIGKDISANLINMVKKFEGKPLDNMFKHFKNEGDKIKKKLMLQGITGAEVNDHPQYSVYQEKIDVIYLLSENCKTVREIIAKIESIFKNENSVGIKLSTVHKAKGLESARAFIIHEELMPSKYSMKNAEMRKQEYNLIYIAITRAQHHLGYIQDFDAYKTKKNQ